MEFTIESIVVNADSYVSALKHLKHHHPEIYDRVVEGSASATVDDAPTQAIMDEGRIRDRFLKLLLDDRFEVENRIRVLEGKAEITRAQFIAAVKTKLGMG